MRPGDEPRREEDALCHAIFDVLVEECGAGEWRRQEVVSFLQPDERGLGGLGNEYRFQGRLGSGGKLYRRSAELEPDSVFVGAYAEDTKHPDHGYRRAMMDKANARIKALLEAADA